ncbi:MAG: O-antigen ligase family protein, partial [Stellaceae bacterium]
ALSIDLIASLACGLAFPAVGVASDGDYAGAWRGVFLSKNSLGATMLIACLSYYVLRATERRPWLLLMAALAFGLIVVSQSRTSLVILLALIPILALTRRYFRAPRRFAAILGLALCFASFAALFLGVMFRALLHLLGRDATLTGRTDIWLLSWDAIQSRFWIGYGFGAFWSNPWGPASEIWDSLNWRAPSSHSGVLELWLALGAVGVALFAWLLGQTFLRIVFGVAMRRREEALWLIGYFFVFVVHAVTEPSMMEQTSITWVLLVTTSCAVADQRSRARGPNGRASAASRARALPAGARHWPSRNTSRE